MLKQGLIIGAAAIVAIVLAFGGSSEPFEAAEAAVAGCGHSSSPTTTTARAWSGGSSSAGALRVPARPLATMVEVATGQFAARMPVLVGGHDYIVLSVPLALRKRVFLYYGRVADRTGRPLSSLRNVASYAEVEFQPCPDRSRTIWPGAIRVIGRAPVRLLATIEGQPRSIPLALGPPASTQEARGEDLAPSHRALVSRRRADPAGAEPRRVAVGRVPVPRSAPVDQTGGAVSPLHRTQGARDRRAPPRARGPEIRGGTDDDRRQTKGPYLSCGPAVPSVHSSTPPS